MSSKTEKVILHSTIESLIVCPVCKQDYDQEENIPCRLECPHTVCLFCCQQLYDCSYGINCPICRRVTESDPISLNKNIEIMALIDKFNSIELIERTLCSYCNKNPFSVKCSHCNFDFCKQCLQTHIESYKKPYKCITMI